MEMLLSSSLIELTNELENNFADFNRESILPKCIKKAIKMIQKFHKQSLPTEGSSRMKNEASSRQNSSDKSGVFNLTIANGALFRTKKLECKS